MAEFNRNEQITVGTDAIVISVEKNNENNKRKSIILINTSAAAQVITIAIDAQAVAGQGIVLAVGGSWQDSQEGGYLPTQKQITVISNAIGGLVSIQERTGD
jgi:hypothetical protein